MQTGKRARDQALERTREKVQRLAAEPLPPLSADGHDAISTIITMPDKVILRELMHAEIDIRHSSWSKELDERPATVQPVNSRLVTVYVDAQHALYFYFNTTPVNLYTSSFQWSVLGNMLPPSSVFRGIFFADAHGATVLGLFDIRAELGEQVRDPVLERHRRLHAMLSKMRLPPFVRHHWVGFARDCYACLAGGKLPFATNGMLLLDDDDAAEPHGRYLRVLSPITIPPAAPVQPRH